MRPKSGQWRPVYLKWNNHNWRNHRNSSSLVETTTNEAYTNQSTVPDGNAAPEGSADRDSHERNPTTEVVGECQYSTTFAYDKTFVITHLGDY